MMGNMNDIKKYFGLALEIFEKNADDVGYFDFYSESVSVDVDGLSSDDENSLKGMGWQYNQGHACEYCRSPAFWRKGYAENEVVFLEQVFGPKVKSLFEDEEENCV